MALDDAGTCRPNDDGGRGGEPARELLHLGSFHILRPQWMGGAGSPKSRRKEQNQLICDSDKRGGGVKKSEKFADVIYGSPLTNEWSTFETSRLCPSS